MDLCGSSDTVIEYVCKEVNGYTYVLYKDDGVGISCNSTYGSGYSCEDGACVGSASAGSEETVVEEAVSEEESVVEEESLLAAGSSCEDNSECASQFCEVGECVECSLDEHCASGEICDSNVCVSSAGPLGAPSLALVEEEKGNFLVRILTWLFTFEWGAREKFISQ